MAESHVVSALKDKRAELSGELLVAQARLDKLRLDIAAVDRSLALFDPTISPQSITPIIRRPRVKGRFRHGARTATLLTILRNADRPLTICEIAQEAAKQFDIPRDTPVTLTGMDNRMRTALKKQRAGIVSEWNGSVTVWRLETDSGDVLE
jgi:hypothetical protein